MNRHRHIASVAVVNLVAAGAVAIGCASAAAAPAAETKQADKPIAVDKPVVAGKPHLDVVALLEDNAETLLPKLNNPQGGSGEGHVETKDVFAGRSGVRIIPDQRYARSIEGWKYRIVEIPAAGEYRFLRFAWKAPACSGVMLQLHDDRDWNIRYTAGVDKYGWGTRFVSGKPPAEWSVVTVDLFTEFGARTIRGMALTCFDGPAGYFDHIYLGRTLDDLDRIDATGYADEPRRDWSRDELESRWQEANSQRDASAAYRAFWALAAAEPAVPFLADKLRTADVVPEETTLRGWIADLDADDYERREAASRRLAKHVRMAADLLNAELKASESREVKARIKLLLKQQSQGDSNAERALKAVRVLEVSRAAEAGAALEQVAKGPQADRVSQAAREALARRMARATNR